MLAHMVYFKLKDDSPSAQAALVKGSKEFLSDHPGMIHFSVGKVADAYRRDVNERDWDVALHLVFEDHQAHDTYQSSPRHNQFIAKFKENWAKVRVFDADTL